MFRVAKTSITFVIDGDGDGGGNVGKYFDSGQTNHSPPAVVLTHGRLLENSDEQRNGGQSLGFVFVFPWHDCD